jgi:hypothetical protein
MAVLRFNERPKWRPPENEDGKRHDNPNHAGQRSHQQRMAQVNSSYEEVLDMDLKFASKALSQVRRVKNGR